MVITSFSVIAGNYLPARVLFCYGPKKLFAQLTHAVEVSCIWYFLTKGMNNMVCCILFNLCILHGYLCFLTPKDKLHKEGDTCLFCCYSYTLVKMYACLKSKENDKYANSISGHVDDSGAVSMKRQRKFSCYGFVKTGKPLHSTVW